VMRPSSEGK